MVMAWKMKLLWSVSPKVKSLQLPSYYIFWCLNSMDFDTQITIEKLDFFGISQRGTFVADK